jgi:hypothetical protein
MSPLTGAPVAAAPSAPKPAFKVTRSPFAPKIIGTATTPGGTIPTGSVSGAMSIGASSALGDAPVPGLMRKTVSARASQDHEVGAPMVVVDFIAAAVAIAGAVMLAMDYYKH